MYNNYLVYNELKWLNFLGTQQDNKNIWSYILTFLHIKVISRTIMNISKSVNKTAISVKTLKL